MTVSWKQAVNIPTMSDLYNDLPFKNLNSFQRITIYANQQGTIAQLVEQWLEAPCVVGSTPARTISGRFQPDNLC